MKYVAVTSLVAAVIGVAWKVAVPVNRVDFGLDLLGLQHHTFGTACLIPDFSSCTLGMTTLDNPASHFGTPRKHW